MPTFEAVARFLRDYALLAQTERELFRVARIKFVEDLSAATFALAYASEECRARRASTR